MKRQTLEILRWALVLAALISLIVMGAKNKVSSAEPEDVHAAVISQVDLSVMQKGDNRMIKRFYGLQPSDFEDCLLYYPTTNMGAEELLILKLADPAQQEAVAAAVEKRLETQKNSFDGYGIEQYDLLTNHAVVEIRGNYVLFIVNENAEAARQAFLDAL